jgi:hypothetical protein
MHPRAEHFKWPQKVVAPTGGIFVSHILVIDDGTHSAGAGFVIRSLIYPRPIVDLRAFASRNFTLGCWCSFVTGVGTFGLIYLTPLSTVTSTIGNLPPDRLKSVSGLFALMRNLGGAIGIAVSATGSPIHAPPNGVGTEQNFGDLAVRAAFKPAVEAAEHQST